jgi:hypothetical protein
MIEERKIGFGQLFLLVILFSFLIQALHEGGHWAANQIAGRQPVWGVTSLVQIWGETPLHPEKWLPTVAPDGEPGWYRMGSAPASQLEFMLELAAGPFVSLWVVLASLALALRSKNPRVSRTALLLCLVGALTSAQYYLRAPLRSSNGDEYFMAAYFGFSKLWLEIPLGVVYLVCLVYGLAILENWRTRAKWFGALILGSPLTGIFMARSNEYLIQQINLENPLFMPVIGYSLPVLLVNSLVVIILAGWWYQAFKTNTPPVS